MRPLVAWPLVAATLLGPAVVAAQPRRNGSEYGFKDHQPTHADVVRREQRAGAGPPPAQVRQNADTVQQLDRQLLHEEAADPPGSPDRQIPPIHQ